MAEDDRTRGVVLIGGLALAALGQFYFAHRRQYVWDGVLFWAAGIIVVSLALRRARQVEQGAIAHADRARPSRLSSLRRHPARTLMWSGGAWLSITAGWLARQRSPNAGFADLLALWMIGVASFLIAIVPALPTLPELHQCLVKSGRLGKWLRRNRVELAGLAVLGVLALVVRTYDLEHIPANLGGDEGTQGAEALDLVRAPLGNPFSTSWFSVPTMSFLVYGASMRVFGATVGGLRTVSAVVGAATVLTTFLLARELWGDRIAWFSAAVLTFAHYHIHFSRLGSNQIGDGLFVTLSLWLLVRGLRTRQVAYFAGSGAALGLGWYGYFGARLVGIIAACYLGLHIVLRHRFLARRRRPLAIMVAAAVVVIAPLLRHYAAHPVDLVSRPRQVSILAPGWLAREREFTGRTTVSLLLQQVWKSISAFNYTLDPTFWYRASIPLLDFVSGLLFIVGLLWTVAHYRWPSSLLLLIWFGLALLLGWVLTENPPSSQRMVIVAPALALFVGLGLDWLLDRLHRLLGVHRAVRLGLATLLIVAVAGLNLRYYFLVYTPTLVYGNPTAEMTTVLARHLKGQGNDEVVYFHGAPFVYWDHGTLRFLARGIVGTDVPPPGEGEPPEPDLAQGVRFVFHPERLGELKSVRARYPGGTEQYVRSTVDDELLYVMYEVHR